MVSPGLTILPSMETCLSSFPVERYFIGLINYMNLRGDTYTVAYEQPVDKNNILQSIRCSVGGTAAMSGDFFIGWLFGLLSSLLTES